MKPKLPMLPGDVESWREDPPRWLDTPQLDPKLRSAIDSLPTPTDLSPAVEARVFAALSRIPNAIPNPNLPRAPSPDSPPDPAPSLVPDATTPTIPAGSSVVAAKIWLWVVPSLVVTLGVLAVVGLDRRPDPSLGAVALETSGKADSSTQPPTTDPDTHSQPALAPTTNPDTHLRPALAPSVRPGATDTAAPPPETAVGPGARVRSASRPPPSTLAAETRLLEAARSQVAANPANARRLLEAYAVRFPRGVLQEECELLWVKLAVSEGDAEVARKRAAAMGEDSSRSPYAQKATEIVDANEEKAGSRTSTK